MPLAPDHVVLLGHRGGYYQKSFPQARVVLDLSPSYNAETMADAEEIGATTETPRAAGMSPYATGGGGISFERRVAVGYLAQLLTGATSALLRGRRVEKVQFQQAPDHPIDDLVVTAMSEVGTDILELNIAIRRAPKFVASDDDTVTLFRALLQSILLPVVEGVERRYMICVAGSQRAALEVSQLCAIAESQDTEGAFFGLLRTPRKFANKVVARLDRICELVASLLALDGVLPPTSEVEAHVWRLLSCVDISMPRLEPPDESDWADLLNLLEPWSRERTIAGALALRDRLTSLAAQYAPFAASVNASILRRDANDSLHHAQHRRSEAWRELRQLHGEAASSVGSDLGTSSRGQTLHLRRSECSARLRERLRSQAPLLVSGESGVGKSALVLSTLNEAVLNEPAEISFVCLNLRRLPPTMGALRDALGASLESLLAEMSTPHRILVVDAADVAAERVDVMLEALLRAAHAAGVTPCVVSANDGCPSIRSTIEESCGAYSEMVIDGLTDSELEEVGSTFPFLRRLVDEPRAKTLLRRPVVVDLFVRAGSSGLPLSEADAFEIVWKELIRNAEQSSRGLPDARDWAMQQLATVQLRRVGTGATQPPLDPSAVAGLYHDGLLRKPDRWGQFPTFAHELVRTYAATRVLLAEPNLADAILEYGAPRWVLPAVRIGLQVELSLVENGSWPVVGKFVELQQAMERIVSAGHGARWSDLPTEAALTLADVGAVLRETWPSLLDGESAGLQRLLRILLHRHARNGLVERLVAEPVIALFLEKDWPKRIEKEVNELLTSWLRGLAAGDTPEGHPLRIALRQRLVTLVSEADDRLAVAEREDALRRAASESVVASAYRRRRKRVRTRLPRELIDDTVLEQLALLGPDVGREGEALLRRVASEYPEDLAPAVDAPLVGHALVAYSPELLVDLIEAYYIDEDENDNFGLHEYGIRSHGSAWPMPQTAYYLGPFLALIRKSPLKGIACLNRLLDHAARSRVRLLRGLERSEQSRDAYEISLAIGGEQRVYVGDVHVWLWYRGTGVGPYALMSALQALEYVCDEFIKAGVKPSELVPILLDRCGNLAMPALVVGMLVRHLEQAGTALDPFLAEPAVWTWENNRAAHEHSPLAVQHAALVALERRKWNFRHLALNLALNAAPERAEQLRALGRKLVSRAAERIGLDPLNPPLTEELAVVRNWAEELDRTKYRLTEVEGGLLVERIVSDEVRDQLAPTNRDIARNQRALSFSMQYTERFHGYTTRRPSHSDLLSDLSFSRELVDEPLLEYPSGPYAAPAIVAAAAFEAHFRDRLEISVADLVWAGALLVRCQCMIADGVALVDMYSMFGSGIDRSTARALPFLLLPAAGNLESGLGDEGINDADIARALSSLATNNSQEAQLYTARACDLIWETQCTSTASGCHHKYALALLEDTTRESLIGPWVEERPRRMRLRFHGAASSHLLSIGDDQIVDPSRLTAAIRGSSAAAVSNSCCKQEAETLLHAALFAHRRGMLSHEDGYHNSSDDVLVAARAAMDIAASGNESS